MDDSLNFFKARNAMAATLIHNSRIPYEFEDSDLIDVALETLPLGDLYGAAEKRQAHDDGEAWGFQDHLIRELLRWFKQDFFTWVNTLPCSICGGKTDVIGAANPTPEEKRGGAGRVELHRCVQCEHIERFPRYNDLRTLLSYRKGRCGEWAHCFSFLCRALGSRVRYIWNAEDHVWTEVYSEKQQRWIHCDSCEEAWDNPTLYGNGWGKKMSYVIGFSVEGATDVTKRYVRDPSKALPREKIDADMLMTLLTLLTVQSRQTLPQDQREQLEFQDQIEYAELDSYILQPPPSKTAVDLPRQSGKGEWTKQRGEDGSSS